MKVFVGMSIVAGVALIVIQLVSMYQGADTSYVWQLALLLYGYLLPMVPIMAATERASGEDVFVRAENCISVIFISAMFYLVIVFGIYFLILEPS